MGVVHLGVSPDGDLVAVKALRPWLVGGHDGRNRFEREVATLRRVTGPRIAEVLDADLVGDPPYIVTRYVRGSTLDKVVDDHGPLRTEALARFAAGLAEAVTSVHGAGVIHRDVKPGNVIMTDGGPVLIDFGIARSLDETRLTATGLVIGTPGYLAPEVVLGQPPSPATDVHGWAATVAFAGTGRPPYGSGPDAAVLDRIRRSEHDLGDIDAGLAAILRRALVADPAERPAIDQVRISVASPDGDATVIVNPGVGTAPETVPVAPPGPPTRVAEPPTVAAPNAAQPQISVRPGSTAGPPAQPAPQPPAPQLPTPPQQARPAAPAPQPRAVPSGPGPNGMAPPLTTWPARLAVAAAGLALLILLGVAPYSGVIVLFAGLVVARVTWRTRRNLYERRIARGYQPRDQLVAAAGTPWYVLVAALPSALQTVLVGLCGLLVGAAVNVSGEATVRFPYVAGGVVVIFLAWFGPATSQVRHGVRALAAPLDRNRRVAWIVLGVLIAISWILLLIWESYGTAWGPGGPPLNPLDRLG